MALLGDTASAISNAFFQIWEGIVFALPGLLAAILILVLGYLVGALVGRIVREVLERTRVIDIAVRRMGLRKHLGKWDLNGFFGLITKWYIFLVFLNPAAQIVSLESLSNFFLAVALWIPNIILAIIVVLAGYVLAEYLAAKINETKAKKHSFLASCAKVITMVFVILVALKQIGLEVSVAENTFLIILAGVMLALAIGFGLALRDEAKSILKHIKKGL